MRYWRYLLPVAVAFGMSIVSSRYLFVGSALSLIPWGILALSWGLVARDKSEAVRLGGVYGFSQAFIFLWVDKAGGLTLTQFFLLLVIITGLAVLAAASAAVAARLGYWAKTKLHLA